MFIQNIAAHTPPIHYLGDDAKIFRQKEVNTTTVDAMAPFVVWSSIDMI